MKRGGLDRWLRRLGGAVVFGLAVSVITWPVAGWAQQTTAGWPSLSTGQAGVTIQVTPKSIAAGAAQWEFAVVLDTHSQDLDDDLVRIATLMTDDGRRLSPTGWVGAPPGGHHREGVLQFSALEPAPRAIELRIHRVGESAPRVYRWQL